MRIFNFSILTGPRVTNSDINATGEIASGSIGSEVQGLDIKNTPVRSFGFMTSMVTSDGYGGVNYHAKSNGKTATETVLALSQSIGGTVPTNKKEVIVAPFFIVEKNYRG